MELLNRETGAHLQVTLRPLRREDATGAIACLRDAYCNTYVKPYLYREEGLWAHQESGALSFSVAETAAGDLAGIIACETSPLFPTMAEIACLVIRREYCGFGLALPLALYQRERAAAGEFQSQFSRALGCQRSSQKTLSSMGFTPCGFLLSVFDQSKLTTRYHGGGNPKIPQAVAVKRQCKTAAGPLYVPDHLVPLAAAMYKSLGLSWSRSTEAAPPQTESCWAWEQDARHNTLLLFARSPGVNFTGELAQALAAVGKTPGQTVNLLLNLSCSGSFPAYRAAEAAGFLFTGFLPCGADGEYMILHHPLAVPVEMGKIPYIPAYEPYAAEIRRQYHAR